MKKLLAIFLSLALLYFLSACGGCGGSSFSADSPSGSASTSESTFETVFEPAPDTSSGRYAPGERTKKLFSGVDRITRVVMSMAVDMGEGQAETVELTYGIKDGVTAADFTGASTGHTTILIKEGMAYTIMHDMRIIMKVDREELNQAMETPIDLEKLGTEDYTDAAFTAGVETIAGTKYEYDELVDQRGGTMRFCFEPGSGKWDGLSGTGEFVKILEYGGIPDPAIFELPHNYAEMDMVEMISGRELSKEGLSALSG